MLSFRLLSTSAWTTCYEVILCIHKKCQSRIYCLQKLRNIVGASDILEMYYRTCIESVLTVSFMCWYGSLGVRGKKVLNDVVNVYSNVVGKRQACMQDLYERRLKWRARQIAGGQSHVLAKCFELLPSGRRYKTVKGKTRLLKSFISRCLHLLNS